MQHLPNSVDKLIDQLAADIPLKLPKPGQRLDAVFYEAGRRSVVEMLIRLRQERDNRDQEEE